MSGESDCENDTGLLCYILGHNLAKSDWENVRRILKKFEML